MLRASQVTDSKTCKAGHRDASSRESSMLLIARCAPTRGHAADRFVEERRVDHSSRIEDGSLRTDIDPVATLLMIVLGQEGGVKCLGSTVTPQESRRSLLSLDPSSLPSPDGHARSSRTRTKGAVSCLSQRYLRALRQWLNCSSDGHWSARRRIDIAQSKPTERLAPPVVKLSTGTMRDTPLSE
jgi:hypothetical protein